MTVKQAPGSTDSRLPAARRTIAGRLATQLANSAAIGEDLNSFSTGLMDDDLFQLPDRVCSNSENGEEESDLGSEHHP